MISELITHIPAHETYVEVFGGSAELLFSKYPSKQEVYNDINGDLVNLFLQVRDNLDKIMDRLQWLPHSREIHEKWCNDFRKGLAPSDPIERAARFYYILCTQFAGKMLAGWAYGKGKKYWGPSRISKLPAISKRLENVTVEHSDFRKTIQVWDSKNTFFFLDPPYYDTADYKQGFNEQDHRDLAELLSTLDGTWLLTYNDHPFIRDLYSCYKIESMEIQLTSKKIEANEKRPRFINLIIKNFDQSDPSQSLLGTYLYTEVYDDKRE